MIQPPHSSPREVSSGEIQRTSEPEDPEQTRDLLLGGPPLPPDVTRESSERSDPGQSWAPTPAAGSVDPDEQTRVLNEPGRSLPALAIEDDELGQGDFVGRYSVLSRLGRGGMGVVYKAYDPQLDRNVALKLLRTGLGPHGSLRLLREARTLAKLKHPNVVAVYDAGMTHHGVFIAMELLEGQTLSQWLRAQPRRVAEILHVFREAGRGLVAAHEAGFVHRDFKPSNVFVGADGAIRVLDFGLAHHVERNPDSHPTPTADRPAEDRSERDRADPPQGARSRALEPSVSAYEVFSTEEGAIVGTPAFMAPEQFTAGHSDHRSEQFAFAMSLYVSLYQRTPPGSESFEARRQCVEQGLSFDEGELERSAHGERVPARIRQAIVRGLDVDPERRFGSMNDLLGLLEPRRRRWRAGVAGLTLILGFGAGAMLFSRDPPCDEPVAALGGVWSEADRVAIEEAFVRNGWAESRSRVEQRLDEYTAAWVQMYEHSCRATFVDRRQSERLFDQRMRCLERRRSRLRSSVDSLAGSQTAAELVSRMVLPFKLPSIEPCGDLDAMMAERPLPDDDSTRQQIAALRRRLDEASTFYDTGEYSRGIEVAVAVVEQARGLEYPPLLAEALEILGLLQGAGAGAVEAETTLREAIGQGAAAHADRSAAAAWTHLLFVLARQHRIEEGLAFELPARAAVDRANDDVVRSWLLNSLGFLHSEQREYDRARELLSEALQVKQAALGEDHVDVGTAWHNLGNTLTSGGRLAEASHAFARAKEVFESTVGPDHPLSHFALSGQCRVEQRQGHAEVAVSLCTEVLERFEALPPSPMWVSRVNFTLANAQWALGREDAARGSARRALEAIEHENPKMAARLNTWLAEHEPTVGDDVEGSESPVGVR
ncbi:MAG: serine/threonine-protein kinase [Myxococcota bacterium]